MFRVLKYGFLLCLLLFVGLLALNLRPLPGPNQPAITVSPATTYATGPLKPNGDVDYIQWVNEQCSEGVTPATNAVVDLVRVVGPRPEGADLPPRFFARLGIAPPPLGGTYIEELYLWLKRDQGWTAGLEPALARLSAEEQDQLFKCVPFDPAKNPSVLRYLAEMDPLLNQIRAASLKPDWYMPYEGDSVVGCLLPYVQRTRSVARVLQVSAMRHLGKGATDLAITDALTIIRLGRLAGRKGTLVEMLVGIALEGIGQGVIRQIVASRKCNDEQLADLLAALEAIGRPQGMNSNHVKIERAMGLDLVARAARGKWDELQMFAGPQAAEAMNGFLGSLASASVDWNEVCVLLNQSYDELAALIAETDREVVLQGIRAVETRSFSDESPLKVLGNALGGRRGRATLFARMVSRLVMPAVSQLWQAGWRQEAWLDVLRTAIAIERFRLQHQRLPESLDELVPGFVGAIPQDLFAGKPLTYHRNGDDFQIYNVGPDRKDNGGLDLDFSSGAGVDLPGVPTIRTVEDQLRQFQAESKR